MRSLLCGHHHNLIKYLPVFSTGATKFFPASLAVIVAIFFLKFFSCLSQGFGPSVAAIPPQRRGDSEIVFSAVTASDLRPEPRNVHRIGAADETEKQLWRLNYS